MGRKIADLDVSFVDDKALPPGLVFTDLREKKWRIGKPIGRGSFGRIYLASDAIKTEVTKENARYVVKIEPHSNGPLFVEVHCLMRTGKVDMVKEWREDHKMKAFGMPIYIGSGSFVDKDTKYRFLILPRYHIDLEKIILNRGCLDLKNVLVLAKQIIEVLEYIHKYGYTHSDIKSSNLMIGFDYDKLSSSEAHKLKEALLAKNAKKSTKMTAYYYDDDFTVKNLNKRKGLKRFMTEEERRNFRHHAFNLRQLNSFVNYEDVSSSVCSDLSYQQLLDDGLCDSSQTNSNPNDCYKVEAIQTQSSGQVYLLDFGLASKFIDSNGKHKKLCMDQRRAHDGTLEYSSRDSHIGAHSRRSDLETLGYNLLDWLTGTLPWKTTEIVDPSLVHDLKINYMSDVKSLLTVCFKSESYPKFIQKYFEYVTSLDFIEKPNYTYMKSIFVEEFVERGFGSEKSMILNLLTQPKVNYSKKFGNKKTSPGYKLYGRENAQSVEHLLKGEHAKKVGERIRIPCAILNSPIKLKQPYCPFEIMSMRPSPKVLRSKKRGVMKKRGKKTKSSIGKFGNFMGSGKVYSWAEVLASNPEEKFRLLRKMQTKEKLTDDVDSKCRTRKNSDLSSDSSTEGGALQSPLMQMNYLEGLNPTYAMKAVINNFRKKNGLSKQRKNSPEVPVKTRRTERRSARNKSESEPKKAVESVTTKRRPGRPRKLIQKCSEVSVNKLNDKSVAKVSKSCEVKLNVNSVKRGRSKGSTKIDGCEKTASKRKTTTQPAQEITPAKKVKNQTQKSEKAELARSLRSSAKKTKSPTLATNRALRARALK